MAYALIDNASLTAAQRVLGHIPVRNPDTVNGDLLAFENLVQAILFYDDLLCLDDYKKTHRHARQDFFHFIRFISPADFQLDQIANQARVEANTIRPEIRGGQFADPDFQHLLESLKLNIVCTWDLRSSVYYLTMKMLGQPDTPEFQKYSEISAAIYNELSDAAETFGRWADDVQLVASDGTVHVKEEMQKPARAASRGLGLRGHINQLTTVGEVR